MRIVYVDCNLFREVSESTVCGEVVCDNALEGSGNEEILLSKPEQLAFVVVVRRLKHL